jgi:omega-6 fatty acid desaturase (delta-12 desaturase)
MNPVMQWFTGNIGYHHVHHLNSRIPFYRLKEAMLNMPELQNVTTTSWSPMEMARCFSLKLWDPERGKMISLRELQVR